MSVPDVRELLGDAWRLISQVAESELAEQTTYPWTDEADAWRQCYEAYLKATVPPSGQPDPELPPGEYARVEIMGHASVTGWVTDGTRAGVPVMVVRDWDGKVLREVPGHSLYQFRPLPTPLRYPEPVAAITCSSADGTSDDAGAEDFYGEAPF